MIGLAILRRDFLKLVDRTLRPFKFGIERRLAATRDGCWVDVRSGDGDCAAEGLTGFIGLAGAPSNEGDNEDSGEEPRAQSVQDGSSFTLQPVAETIEEAHRRVAESIVPQLARPLFVVLSHLVSFRKPAWSAAFC